MNKTLAVHVLQAFLDAGGREICLCPGSRNAPLISLIASSPALHAYYFFEERSAAFFALGLSRRTKRPVAVVTTSGTAAVELMPAVTEAYYTGVPLVALTADRPRSYRGTNAPQSCEQVGLYGKYTVWEADLEGSERIDLTTWDQRGPAHINVCFNEPLKCEFSGKEISVIGDPLSEPLPARVDLDPLTDFFDKVSHPLVIVGTLDERARSSVRRFLRKLDAPVYAEGVSGLREDLSLAHLRIHRSGGLWKAAEKAGYPIDGILRIGGIPTVRLWRDLEDREGEVRVCSISEQPFSGLSWAKVVQAPLRDVFEGYEPPQVSCTNEKKRLFEDDRCYQKKLEELFVQEPNAEASLVHALATKLEEEALVYLGNSMPIREWDLAAPYLERGLQPWATRGLSGIDGQISTFLGLCKKGRMNWALLGDLTALYDMAGFWVASQLEKTPFNLVVINNSGGQIFTRMYGKPEFINAHGLDFKPLAEMWKLDYVRWNNIPDTLPKDGQRIIELVPDNKASQRFWDNVAAL